MVNCTTVMTLPLFVAILLLISLINLHPSDAQRERQLEDSIVVQAIHLDYADAEHLASVLAPRSSMDGRVVTYRPANSLIIKHRAWLVKRLAEIRKRDPDP